VTLVSECIQRERDRAKVPVGRNVGGTDLCAPPQRDGSDSGSRGVELDKEEVEMMLPRKGKALEVGSSGREEVIMMVVRLLRKWKEVIMIILLLLLLNAVLLDVVGSSFDHWRWCALGCRCC
jgi:hypothetical protein